MTRFPDISIHLFKNDDIITEKIDGSNFGFGFLKNDDHVLQFKMRSRNKFLTSDSKDFMLHKPIEDIIRKKADLLKTILPFEQFMVYGEIFGKESYSNKLKYDRNSDSIFTFQTDKIYFVAFDLYNVDDDIFIKYNDYSKYFETIHLPYLKNLKDKLIKMHNYAEILDLFQIVEIMESEYGANGIEGFVIKPNIDEKKSKRTCFKLVRERFNNIKNYQSFNKYKIKTYFHKSRIYSAASKLGLNMEKINIEKNIRLIMEEVKLDCMKDINFIILHDPQIKDKNQKLETMKIKLEDEIEKYIKELQSRHE